MTLIEAALMPGGLTIAVAARTLVNSDRADLQRVHVDALRRPKWAPKAFVPHWEVAGVMETQLIGVAVFLCGFASWVGVL